MTAIRHFPQCNVHCVGDVHMLLADDELSSVTQGRSVEPGTYTSSEVEMMASQIAAVNGTLAERLKTTRELLDETLNTWANVVQCQCVADVLCASCAARSQLRGRAELL
mgnify:CR=1 FL=1